MKVISILSQKGGAGKTTLAVHLATAAELAGKRTLVVDLDPQATAALWRQQRQAEGPEVIDGKAPRLAHLIQTAESNGADLIIIDTPPTANDTQVPALDAADLVLIPTRPASFDLNAIQTTLRMIALTKKPAYVVLNAVPVQGAVHAEARQVIERAGGQVAPVMLRHRAAYSHAVIDGRTVMEFEPKGKAAGEIQELYGWLCGIVGMPK